MKVLVTIVAIATAAVTSTARGDWQYSRWGMDSGRLFSHAPASAAMRVPTAREAQDRAIRGMQPGLVGFHHAEGFEFIANFYFGYHNGGLSRVYLKLRDYTQSRYLLAALRSQYGEPSVVSTISPSDTIMVWRDEKGGNEIEVYDMAPTSAFLINYTPLRSAKGL